MDDFDMRLYAHIVLLKLVVDVSHDTGQKKIMRVVIKLYDCTRLFFCLLMIHVDDKMTR